MSEGPQEVAIDPRSLRDFEGCQRDHKRLPLTQGLLGDSEECQRDQKMLPMIISLFWDFEGCERDHKRLPLTRGLLGGCEGCQWDHKRLLSLELCRAINIDSWVFSSKRLQGA